MKRRSYPARLTLNGIEIRTVIIDPHYEIKHSKSITDGLILELVNLLDGDDFLPDTVTDIYEYYVTEGLILGGKEYRLIWLIEKGETYIGVINAYRRL